MNQVAQEVVATMQELGYPEHVIQGFLMNYQDESGLNPNIVEAEDNVHGTRGKGLYQLTGGRRAKFEEMYGGDYSPRNQVLFQDWELNNTEKKAKGFIFGSQNAGEAGAAIVSEFLRPAKEHENARIAKYTGNAPPPLPSTENYVPTASSGVPPVAADGSVPPVPEDDNWLTKPLDVTGNETLDGMLSGARDGVVGMGKSALMSALTGGGNKAAPPPPPVQLAAPRHPVINQQPVMFKIKRKRDKSNG